MSRHVRGGLRGLPSPAAPGASAHTACSSGMPARTRAGQQPAAARRVDYPLPAVCCQWSSEQKAKLVSTGCGVGPMIGITQCRVFPCPCRCGRHCSWCGCWRGGHAGRSSGVLGHRAAGCDSAWRGRLQRAGAGWAAVPSVQECGCARGAGGPPLGNRCVLGGSDCAATMSWEHSLWARGTWLPSRRPGLK